MEFKIILQVFAIKYLLRGYLKVSLKLRVYLRQPKDTFTPFSREIGNVGEVVLTWLQYLVGYLLFLP